MNCILESGCSREWIPWGLYVVATAGDVPGSLRL